MEKRAIKKSSLSISENGIEEKKIYQAIRSPEDL